MPKGSRFTDILRSGPSGSGKSSIQQLISRFYDPDEGRILFDGTGMCGVLAEDDTDVLQTSASLPPSRGVIVSVWSSRILFSFLALYTTTSHMVCPGRPANRLRGLLIWPTVALFGICHKDSILRVREVSTWPETKLNRSSWKGESLGWTEAAGIYRPSISAEPIDSATG
jgi:energy-coupling factor transporter ATP-binding protein EcfA2